MSKSIALGVILFALGVVVGRATVLATQTSSGTLTVTNPPAQAAAPMMGAPTAQTGAARGGSIHGKIAEVIQVPQYTYLRLESGEWAAVTSAPSLKTGDEVDVNLQNEMQNFTSSSLGRTFERIWFGTLGGAAAAAPSEAPAMAAAPSAPSAPMVPEVKPALPSGPSLTLRIVDVYAERAMLGGKLVKVKGTVDRVNFVQSLYYVHLKDGTGAAADKSDDLLCISSAEVKKGDAVTMEGVVALEKNVGMGPIPVAMDQAKPL
jgi:hypothetical protein